MVPAGKAISSCRSHSTVRLLHVVRQQRRKDFVQVCPKGVTICDMPAQAKLVLE
jgi:hypothetical protein